MTAFCYSWAIGADPKVTSEIYAGKQRNMVNLKIGGILLVAGAALFLLSDTLFGDSDAAASAAFLGLIMFPLGVILSLVGAVQVLVEKIKGRSRQK